MKILFQPTQIGKRIKKVIKNMKYYELIHSVVLKQDIPYTKSFEMLSQYINQAMLKDTKLKELHINKATKLYNFSSFYPLETDKIYKKGRVYIFRMRSIDQSTISKLMVAMKKVSHQGLQIISSELVTKKQKPIQELVSLTPIVLTTELGYALPEVNRLDFVENRLKGLLEKKYKQYFNNTMQTEQLSLHIEQKNYKPIKIPYKNIHLLGNKFKLEIDMTDEAQALATMALACGLGEKTGLGFGYVVANYVRR